jgi:MFS family permease
MSSAVVSVIGMCGVLLPWHLGLAALVSGTVYATEMPARHRIIAECAGDDARPRAIAVDSMTNYATRCAGPLAGGLAYRHLGLPGAFLISAVCSTIAFLLILRIPYSQASATPVRLRKSLTDLRDPLSSPVRARRFSYC